jgi:hypothetical protein
MWPYQRPFLRNRRDVRKVSVRRNTIRADVSPTAPIYVVQGTSGALPENVFFDPAPAWFTNRNGNVTITYHFPAIAVCIVCKENRMG